MQHAITRGHPSEHKPPIDPDPSLRNAAVTAGAGILLMAALAPFGIFVAVEGLVTPGDAARTATDIAGSEQVFRFGIVSLFVVAALDVVVAWALYPVFSRASRQLSMLAAWVRLAYAVVFVVAIGRLVSVLDMLDSDAYLAGSDSDRLHAEVLMTMDGFFAVYSVGLVLFGLHLVVLGYLAYRSGYVPKVLGALVAVSGLGYAVDSIAAVLFPGPLPELANLTFVGEFLLALWLVTRGRRAVQNEPANSSTIQSP